MPEFGRRPRTHRIRRSNEAGCDVADDAGPRMMIEREALTRFLDLDDDRTFGEMPACRVPDVFEERPPQRAGRDRPVRTENLIRV